MVEWKDIKSVLDSPYVSQEKKQALMEAYDRDTWNFDDEEEQYAKEYIAGYGTSLARVPLPGDDGTDDRLKDAQAERDANKGPVVQQTNQRDSNEDSVNNLPHPGVGASMCASSDEILDLGNVTLDWFAQWINEIWNKRPDAADNIDVQKQIRDKFHENRGINFKKLLDEAEALGKAQHAVQETWRAANDDLGTLFENWQGAGAGAAKAKLDERIEPGYQELHDQLGATAGGIPKTVTAVYESVKKKTTDVLNIQRENIGGAPLKMAKLILASARGEKTEYADLLNIAAWIDGSCGTDLYSRLNDDECCMNEENREYGINLAKKWISESFTPDFRGCIESFNGACDTARETIDTSFEGLVDLLGEYKNKFPQDDGAQPGPNNHGTGRGSDGGPAQPGPAPSPAPVPNPVTAPEPMPAPLPTPVSVTAPEPTPEPGPNPVADPTPAPVTAPEPTPVIEPNPDPGDRTSPAPTIDTPGPADPGTEVRGPGTEPTTPTTGTPHTDVPVVPSPPVGPAPPGTPGAGNQEPFAPDAGTGEPEAGAGEPQAGAGQADQDESEQGRNPITGQPLEIDPETGSPYPIDPETGEPVTDGADEPDKLTVHKGVRTLSMDEPNDDGNMSIHLDEGDGRQRDYQLDFSDMEEQGADPAESADGAEQVNRPDDDGKIRIDDGGVEIVAEQPEGQGGPTKVTVDDGFGDPTSYTLGEADGHRDADELAADGDKSDVGARSSDSSHDEPTESGASAADRVSTSHAGGADELAVDDGGASAVDADGAHAQQGSLPMPTGGPQQLSSDVGAATPASSGGFIDGMGQPGASGNMDGQLPTEAPGDRGHGAQSGSGAQLDSGIQSGTAQQVPVEAAAGIGAATADAPAGASAGVDGAGTEAMGMLGGAGGAAEHDEDGQQRGASQYRVVESLFDGTGVSNRISGSLNDQIDSHIRYDR